MKSGYPLGPVGPAGAMLGLYPGNLGGLLRDRDGTQGRELRRGSETSMNIALDLSGHHVIMSFKKETEDKLLSDHKP